MSELVALTTDDVDRAHAWADEVEARLATRGGTNPSGWSKPGRFVTGYLGELAFARWCEYHELLARHNVELRGIADCPEFYVWTAGMRLVSVDVKTRTSAQDMHFYMPECQPLDADLYIVAHVESVADRLVMLVGFTNRPTLQAARIGTFGYGPTRVVPINGLGSMERLRNRLEPRVRIARHPQHHPQHLTQPYRGQHAATHH